MSGSQSVTLKNSGISSQANVFSVSPQGSASDAVNVVIDRDAVIEPRRGFYQYGSTFGTPSDTIKQLINYKDVIFRHVLTKLQFDADVDGDFRDITNSDGNVEEISTGYRLKSQEVNGNLYICTRTGVKKISARDRLDLLTVPLEDAGGPKGLDITAELNFTTPGWLEPNSKAAYRVMFGKKDLNENLILGAPSSPAVVYNFSTSSCTTTLTFSLPADVTTQHFYQIYRTGLSTDTPPTEPGDPGDEMNLIFEENITSANILAGEITVEDITPEDFRRSGTLLYTNPVSGEGILQANEKPPFAKDIALYKNYTFFANTSSMQRLTFSILTVDGITSNVDTITISDNNGTDTVYTFQGTNETFTADYTGAATTDLYNAAAGPAKHFTVASANDERKYYVWNYQGVDDLDPGPLVPALAGYIGIKNIILNTDTLTDIRSKTGNSIMDATDDFNVIVSTVSDEVFIACANNGPVATTPTENITNFTITSDDAGTGEDIPANKIFLPRIPVGEENGPTVSQQLEQIAKSMVRVINAQDPLVAGYYQSTYASVPGQMLLEGRDTVGPIVYLYSTVGTNFTPTLPPNNLAQNQVFSSNEVRPNRIMFSKLSQPDAVPLVNFIDVGPKDRAISRIIALRESLFIIKEEGIYRLSGDTAPFIVAPFDSSVQVLAPDTAVVLNNQIYALSTQGVIVVTDTGVQVISRPIENLLLNIIRDGFNYKTISFGVSYESDRSYHLWAPTIVNDTYATQCFRYNTFTNSWTRWNKAATAGLVNFGDNKLYLAPGDLNTCEKERKTLTRKDHADREYELSIEIGDVLDKEIVLSTVENVSIGDVLVQRQYLTIDQFNRLLRKLDDDTGVNDNDYYSTLQMPVGQDIRNQLELLATKLDADTGLSFSNYYQLIDDYTYNINSIIPGTTTIINITGPHDIKVGRFVQFGNTNTFPVLDGRYKVVAIGANSITVDFATDSVGSMVMPIIKTSIEDTRDVQGCYNIITDNLNNDPTTFYTNYPTISVYVDFEINIDFVNRFTDTVTVSENQEFLAGPIMAYNAISSYYIYNPQFFGDPSVDKQVREGTAIFENDNFSTFTMSYASDKYPSFVDTIFQRPGIGDFGQFTYGSVNFGGIAAPIPIRTYVPLDKQRCRFLNVKLSHRVAFEKYSLFGISLTFRPYGIKTNK